MATLPSEETSGARRQSRRNLGWLVVLLVGVVVWIIGAAITAATNDDILVPTLILVGSFLMPLCMVMFALSREGEDQLPHDKILLAFLLGGSVAVVGSAYVEVRLVPASTGTFLTVGLIEELTKALILVVVAWPMTTRRPRDGMVLGATVGAGFAAFESAGYAFSALIQHQHDHPVLPIMQTEISRALWAPFMHITWTALFGGALFAAARGEKDGRFRVTWPLARTALGSHPHARCLGPVLRVGHPGHEGAARPGVDAGVAQHRGLGRRAPPRGSCSRSTCSTTRCCWSSRSSGSRGSSTTGASTGRQRPRPSGKPECRPVDPTRSRLEPARSRATIEGQRRRATVGGPRAEPAGRKANPRGQVGVTLNGWNPEVALSIRSTASPTAQAGSAPAWSGVSGKPARSRRCPCEIA